MKLTQNCKKKISIWSIKISRHQKNAPSLYPIQFLATKKWANILQKPRISILNYSSMRSNGSTKSAYTWNEVSLWINPMQFKTHEPIKATNLCSKVILSMSDCLTSCRSWGVSLAQWPVIFLRRSTAASCRTLGVLAVRRWWTSAGTTCGSFDSRFIWSSACRRASLSGIRNWISSNSSDCAICCYFTSTSLSLSRDQAGGEERNFYGVGFFFYFWAFALLYIWGWRERERETAGVWKRRQVFSTSF